LSLFIHKGLEQDGQELEEKGTGSGRAGYGKQEVLTPLSPPPPKSSRLINMLGYMTVYEYQVLTIDITYSLIVGILFIN